MILNQSKVIHLVNPHKCDWCDAMLFTEIPIIVHINIEQNPKVRTFCSEECKIKWIYKEGEKNG